MIRAYIDPWDPYVEEDRLFDTSDWPVNRDQALLRWAYLRRACEREQIQLMTADQMPKVANEKSLYLYYSLDRWSPQSPLNSRPDIFFGSIYLLEPPTGRHPDLYDSLPELTRKFRRVYMMPPLEEINNCYKCYHNVKTYTYKCPHSLVEVIEPYWTNSDRQFLTMILSYHSSPLWRRELYSERMRGIHYFSVHATIDVYGFWDYVIGRSKGQVVRDMMLGVYRRDFARWRDAITRLRCMEAVRKAFKGPCVNRLYETYSKYEFALCYESSSVRGCVFEKLFDCLLAGTIPIYLGAPDIAELVPPECFIDRRHFRAYRDLHRFLGSLSLSDKRRYREAGRDLFLSNAFIPFSRETFAKRFIEDVKSDWAIAKSGVRCFSSDA